MISRTEHQRDLIVFYLKQSKIQNRKKWPFDTSVAHPGPERWSELTPKSWIEGKRGALHRG
jgi:hypothetical protein